LYNVVEKITVSKRRSVRKVYQRFWLAAVTKHPGKALGLGLGPRVTDDNQRERANPDNPYIITPKSVQPNVTLRFWRQRAYVLKRKTPPVKATPYTQNQNWILITLLQVDGAGFVAPTS